MKVPWPVARCAVCLVAPDPADERTWLTDARVIPASAGGRLSAPFLCRSCDSELGAGVEAPLVSDPGIPVCVEALADRLPPWGRSRRSGPLRANYGRLNL